jgi:hypothetical protein
VTRARSTLLLCLVPTVLLATPVTRAEPGAATAKHGNVTVILVDRVSYEELMGVPQLRSIAAAGGTALMATDGSYRDNELEVFRALGSGAPPGSGQSQVLAHALASRGVDVCVFEPSSPVDLDVPGPTSPLRFLGLGADGGAACSQDPDRAQDKVVFLTNNFTTFVDKSSVGRTVAERTQMRRKALEMTGETLPDVFVPNPLEGRQLVMVLAASPSIDMNREGDEVTPLLMAEGTNLRILGRRGVPRALRSDTTRKDGLVANVDVAPTILDFFGIPIPKEMTGSPIRIDGTADVAHLHQLHLDQRRIRLPLQLGEVTFISFLAILAVGALIWLRLGRRLPAWVTAAMRFLVVCAVALMIPLMAGGLLPRLTYAMVVPFVVLSTVALAAVALKAGWPGPMGPFAFLGAVGLGFMVVDALFGWRGLRIPLLGATMFDGARFYGIPNAFLAALLGSSLFVATLLGPWAGTAFLFGAGLFAGFPALGADLGGAATLFFAAGLWWAVRSSGSRLALRILAPLAIAGAGLMLVVLANRYLPGAPTHITGFVERSGNGLSGVWHAFTRRLDVGVGQLRDVPAGWLPMLGLPVVLVATVVRPEPVGSGFAVAGAVWRDALIVLTLAAMASFFVNDTGVAAAAPVFLYAATAMAYPIFLWARTR